jgi:protein-S-isoprenylcysteine O-methyltransferase Ste14
VVKSSAETRDTPGIVAPMPAVLVAALAVGLVLDRILMLEVLGSWPGLLRYMIGDVLLLLGGWIIYRGIATLRSIGTDFRPWKASTALSTGGIYAKSRNPIYQGALIVLFAVAVLLRSDCTILLAIPAALIIHFGLVLREERYLERKFGNEYLVFKDKVPRYGWPF